MPLLQLALDDLDLETACGLAAQLADQIDIVEAGTPLIKRYGMDAVRQLRQSCPLKLLVADMKTMDAGALEADLAFDAGADRMTVLGAASDRTVEAALAVALKRKKQIAADLLGVVDKPIRARQLAALGVHFIGIHTASDDQRSGDNPLIELQRVRATVASALMVAGGISPQTIPQLLPYKPSVLIVGSFITKSADPVAAVRQLRNAMSENP